MLAYAASHRIAARTVNCDASVVGSAAALIFANRTRAAELTRCAAGGWWCVLGCVGLTILGRGISRSVNIRWCIDR
jgi:hypothetical protein